MGGGMLVKGAYSGDQVSGGGIMDTWKLHMATEGTNKKITSGEFLRGGVRDGAGVGPDKISGRSPILKASFKTSQGGCLLGGRGQRRGYHQKGEKGMGANVGTNTWKGVPLEKGWQAEKHGVSRGTGCCVVKCEVRRKLGKEDKPLEHRLQDL